MENAGHVARKVQVGVGIRRVSTCCIRIVIEAKTINLHGVALLLPKQNKYTAFWSGKLLERLVILSFDS